MISQKRCLLSGSSVAITQQSKIVENIEFSISFVIVEKRSTCDALPYIAYLSTPVITSIGKQIHCNNLYLGNKK